jgi:hypothetical protein
MSSSLERVQFYQEKPLRQRLFRGFSLSLANPMSAMSAMTGDDGDHGDLPI